MGDLVSFIVRRSADLGLSIAARKRGWIIQPTGQNRAALTGSPAGLLLTDRQVQAIPPLLFPASDTWNLSSNRFDPLYDTLYQHFRSHDVGASEAAATSFLNSAPRPVFSEAVQAMHRFMSFKASRATSEEMMAFPRGFSEKELAELACESAFDRIDLLKARALALAVRGDLGGQAEELIDALRAELAFAVLMACVKEASDRPVPLKHVYTVLELAAYLPSWVYQLDPCRGKTRRDPKMPESPLSMRLRRHRVYREQVAVGRSGEDGKDDDCACDDAPPPCRPQQPCCPEIDYYVTELLILREETTCYRPSDIAYIENVAPYETRVRRHGFVKTVEESSETELTREAEEVRDHQVTERFSLEREIENNLARSFDTDAKLSGKIFGQSYEITTSRSLSRDEARREAREQFREAVAKATQTLKVKSRSLVTRKVTTENTESNKHKFTNETSAPAVAKYFWVSQEKRAQVFSHGLRTVVDLYIPSPARLYEHLEALKAARGFTMQEPTPPDPFPISSPDEITTDNYRHLAAQLGLTEVKPPPVQPPILYVNVTVSRNTTTDAVNIPPGYTATLLQRVGGVLHRAFLGFARISVSFGGGTVSQTTNGDTNSAVINQRSSGMATLSKKNASKDSRIDGRITLTPDPVDLSPWQHQVFELLKAKHEEAVAAYEAALAAYQEALAAYQKEREDQIKGRHPFAAEEIMRAEMKRAAIYMMCDDFHPNDAMNPRAHPCGYPEVNRESAPPLTDRWRFFERGFDWRLATIVFYDYFRNPIRDWPNTFDPAEPNFLFKAFRRAGFARIQVPVAPGMEEDVIAFLETGAIWGPSGEPPMDPNDPRWISTIKEIKHARDCYQNDREGFLTAYPDPVDGTFDHRVLVYTDRYWDSINGMMDQDAIHLDLDREIFIDGIAYRIISIVLDPVGPSYNPAPGTAMQWVISLERKFEGAAYLSDGSGNALKPYDYAIGAQYVGAPFSYELPTDLVWIGDHANPCLPCYPISCISDPPKNNEQDESA